MRSVLLTRRTAPHFFVSTPPLLRAFLSGRVITRMVCFTCRVSVHHPSLTFSFHRTLPLVKEIFPFSQSSYSRVRCFVRIQIRVIHHSSAILSINCPRRGKTGRDLLLSMFFLAAFADQIAWKVKFSEFELQISSSNFLRAFTW